MKTTIIKRVSFVLAFLFVAAFFVACTNDDSTKKRHTVKFDTGGGSAIERQIVLDGTSATRPQIPTKESTMDEDTMTMTTL